MKSHLRSLHGILQTALLWIMILTTVAPVAAFESAGCEGPDRPDLPLPAARHERFEVTAPDLIAEARPDPIESNVQVGQTFVINLFVQDVVGLYAADIHLSFDPAILQVEDANPNIPGIQIQPLSSFFVPGFVIKQKACNAPDPGDADCPQGGLAWYAAAQLNPSPPVTGSGPLAAITFEAVNAGESPLTISYQQFSDSTGTTIPSTHLDGTVKVADVVLHKFYLPVITR